MLRAYFDLTKAGIGVFALISALAGYALSFPIGEPVAYGQILLLLAGLYFVSAGSLTLNEAQEWKIDRHMPRTQKRPIVLGLISPRQAYLLSFVFILFGLYLLYQLGQVTAELALLTVILYNGLYTMIWKRRWAFGAVPGAIPGAMPVLIGYSVNHGPIFSGQALYLFLIMFLWQMPHFWCLAIRFKEDYQKGGIPVLPTQIGVPRTLYHIGLYVFAYVVVALMAPWFLPLHYLYVILIFPMALKVLYEFFKYFRQNQRQRWLPFFLWVNFSVLVFVGVPAVERWASYLYVLWF